MKDLLSKEHCSYKIHTLLTKSSACSRPPPSIDNRPIWTTPPPPPHFYKKIFIPPSMIFQKSQTPYK